MHKVMYGKSGYLFLDNDTNHVCQQIMGRMPISTEQARCIDETFKERLVFCDSLGIRYLFLIPPNNHCINSEFLPDDIKISNNRSAVYLSDKYPDFVLYPLEMLKKYKKIYTVCHKTDTHWTNIGASIVFNEISRRFGLNSTIDINNKIKSEEMIGDLGIKITPPISEVYSRIVLEDKIEVVFENKVYGTGEYIHFKTQNNNGIKAVIFGTSSVYHCLDIIPYYFAELHYIWGNIFDFDLIRKLHPDIVISVSNERFFNGEFDKRDLSDALLDKISSVGTLKELDNINLRSSIFPKAIREVLLCRKKLFLLLNGSIENYLVEESNDILGCLDKKEELSNDDFELNGWSYNKKNDLGNSNRMLMMKNEDEEYQFFQMADVIRGDVVKFYNDKSYLHSGFSCRINKKSVKMRGEISIYIAYVSYKKIDIKYLSSISIN